MHPYQWLYSHIHSCLITLHTTSPIIMKGYWRNQAATDAAIDKDGFFHTGDVAYVDTHGYFYVVDRIKELIKVKGFQVAPAELESLILQHPAVANAAVIPIPDERAGELPRAYVTLKETHQSTVSEEDIKEFVKKQVAAYKQLNGGVVILKGDDKIPVSPSGKILRRQLRERAKSDVTK
jgi:4-coumarate--CoA ligase